MNTLTVKGRTYEQTAAGGWRRSVELPCDDQTNALLDTLWKEREKAAQRAAQRAFKELLDRPATASTDKDKVTTKRVKTNTMEEASRLLDEALTRELSALINRFELSAGLSSAALYDIFDDITEAFVRDLDVPPVDKLLVKTRAVNNVLRGNDPRPFGVVTYTEHQSIFDALQADAADTIYLDNVPVFRRNDDGEWERV